MVGLTAPERLAEGAARGLLSTDDGAIDYFPTTLVFKHAGQFRTRSIVGDGSLFQFAEHDLGVANKSTGIESRHGAPAVKGFAFEETTFPVGCIFGRVELVWDRELSCK